MEEPEKGLSTCTTLESHGEKVGAETLDGSGDCGGQGFFSVGEGGPCNGKDVMLEVLGSDVYIDGVCTRGSDAEPNVQVGCGGDSVESYSVVDTTSSYIEVPIMANVGADGALDHEVSNTRCDNAFRCSLTGSSVGGGNDCGALEDGNDVTLETLDEQQNIANSHGHKIMEKEAHIYDKVEFDDELNSVGVQQIGNNEVDDNSNNTLEDVVGGMEVAIDKAPLNSEEKQRFRLEKCTAEIKGTIFVIL